MDTLDRGPGGGQDRLELQPVTASSVQTTEAVRGLPPAAVDAILGQTEDKTFEAGTCVFRLGDRQQGLYLVKAGLVEEYRLTENGGKLPINRVRPGRFLALSSDAGRHCCYADAVEDSTIGFISFGRLEQLLQRLPRVGVNLLDALARRLAEVERRLELATFTELRVRVAWALLGLYGIHGSRLHDITHEELASWAGGSRPKVTQVLDELKEIGLVRLSRGQIEIVDPAALREWARRSTDQ